MFPILGVDFETGSNTVPFERTIFPPLTSAIFTKILSNVTVVLSFPSKSFILHVSWFPFMVIFTFPLFLLANIPSLTDALESISISISPLYGAISYCSSS